MATSYRLFYDHWNPPTNFVDALVPVQSFWMRKCIYKIYFIGTLPAEGHYLYY